MRSGVLESSQRIGREGNLEFADSLVGIQMTFDKPPLLSKFSF